MNCASGYVRKRMVVVLVLVAAIAGWIVNDMASLKNKTKQEVADRSVSTLFLNMPSVKKMDEVYFDENSDLLADTPEEAELIAKPTELVFSFVATDNRSNDPEVWKAATEAIGEKTGLPVTYLKFTDIKKQMAALRGGLLHVTAFDSGSVPAAVKHAGFYPLCTIGGVNDQDHPKQGEQESEEKVASGSKNGKFGYKMQFIVSSDSIIEELEDLRGKNVAFVRPNSNSGCKAAMVHLWQMGLRPEHDYNWHFSLSHANSAKSVLQGKVDAAPVASDILSRLVTKGEVPKDSYRVIYESALFPPVALGCVYNLSPETQQAIRTALLDLDWADTKLAQEMAAGKAKKFVPVAYRDDWSSIRAVDEAVNSIRDQIVTR